MTASTLARRALPQPACSAEFCKTRDAGSVVDSPWQLLAVGTYLLADRESQKKEGRVCLFRVIGAGCAVGTQEGCSDGISYLEDVAEMETSAVFDMKWQPQNHLGSPTMGVACADSCVVLVQLQVVVLILSSRFCNLPTPLAPSPFP